MRQLKLLGIALIAILSLSITATTAAQAVELKFLPEHAKFTIKGNTKPQLRKLAGGESVICETVEGEGEALTERLGDINLLFLGCHLSLIGSKCTGLNDEIVGSVLVTAEYHLRHLLENGDPIIVILITGDGATGSTVVHFTCLGVLITVLGCVASDDLLKDNNTLWVAGELVELFLVNFLPKEKSLGDQAFTSIDTDNSLGMETCLLSSKQEAGTEESSSEEANGVVEKCKSGGVACTFLIDLSGTL